MPGMQMPPQVLARTGEERSLLQTGRVVAEAEKEREGGVNLLRLWDEGGSHLRDRNHSG